MGDSSTNASTYLGTLPPTPSHGQHRDLSIYRSAQIDPPYLAKVAQLQVKAPPEARTTSTSTVSLSFANPSSWESTSPAPRSIITPVRRGVRPSMRRDVDTATCVDAGLGSQYNLHLQRRAGPAAGRPAGYRPGPPKRAIPDTLVTWGQVSLREG